MIEYVALRFIVVLDKKMREGDIDLEEDIIRFLKHVRDNYNDLKTYSISWQTIRKWCIDFCELFKDDDVKKILYQVLFRVYTDDELNIINYSF